MTVFFERINPVSIIKNHFSTFTNNRTGTYDFIEALLVVLAPIGLAALLWIFDILISKVVASYLFNLFAIMGGFLVNALVIIATKKEDVDKKGRNKDKTDLLRETFYNVSFGIFVCIVAVVICAAFQFVPEKTLEYKFISVRYQALGSFFIFSISFLFLHTILMVTKRMDHIFSEYLENK